MCCLRRVHDVEAAEEQDLVVYVVEALAQVLAGDGRVTARTSKPTALAQGEPGLAPSRCLEGCRSTARRGARPSDRLGSATCDPAAGAVRRWVFWVDPAWLAPCSCPNCVASASSPTTSSAWTSEGPAGYCNLFAADSRLFPPFPRGRHCFPLGFVSSQQHPKNPGIAGCCTHRALTLLSNQLPTRRARVADERAPTNQPSHLSGK